MYLEHPKPKNSPRVNFDEPEVFQKKNQKNPWFSIEDLGY